MRVKNFKGSDVPLSKKCTHMYLFIKEPACDTVDDDNRQQTQAFFKIT